MDTLWNCLDPEGCQPVAGHKNTYVTNCEFKVVSQLVLENGGVYLKLFLDGRFDSSFDKWAFIGSLRAKNANEDTCRLMGILSGTLMYHANMYIMRERHRYVPG